jgi:hypothetical protein
MERLQGDLVRSGQFIPGFRLAAPDDLARHAEITASSELRLSRLPASGETLRLIDSWAMMLPLAAGHAPRFTFTLDVAEATTLRAELRGSTRPGNHTPDQVLGHLEIPLAAGPGQAVELDFGTAMPAAGYAFVCLMKDVNLHVHLSDQRLTGVLAVCHNGNKAVAKSATQTPPPGIGIDTFEFWTPKRRPEGKNLAVQIEPPLAAFAPANVANGIDRPVAGTNAWVADFDHEQPVLRLAWPQPRTIRRIELYFDTDFDHPLESVLMGHPERVLPFCVRDARLTAPVLQPVPAGSQAAASASARPVTVAEIHDNHHSRHVITLDEPLVTDLLEIQLVAPAPHIPAALLSVRCYETA